MYIFSAKNEPGKYNETKVLFTVFVDSSTRQVPYLLSHYPIFCCPKLLQQSDLISPFCADNFHLWPSLFTDVCGCVCVGVGWGGGGRFCTQLNNGRALKAIPVKSFNVSCNNFCFHAAVPWALLLIKWNFRHSNFDEYTQFTHSAPHLRFRADVMSSNTVWGR